LTDGDREPRRLAAPILIFALMLVGLLLLLDMDYNVLPFLEVGRWEPLRLALISLVVIGAVWIVLWVIGRLFERMGYARVGSYAQVRSIWKLISYAIWAAVFLILVLGLIGDVTSTALSVGLLGAALAFVLQKPLLNVIGWAYITYHRMLRIGDRISIGNVKGYVVDVRIMHIELMEIGEWMQGDTYTGRIALVPNSLVFEGPIHNYTRDSPFIWDEVVNLVTYESDIDLAKKYMLESAREVIGESMTKNFEKYRRSLSIHDLDMQLLREPELRMELKDSGINIFVVYWCPAEKRRKVKTEVTERIWRRFMEDPRVAIAYPHMEIVKYEQSRGEQGDAPPAKKK
jgi:small-conductance mechanosensitive channel